jgi:hypothetical protein
VPEVALDGIFQNFLINDSFQAQAVHFFEQIVLDARPISSSIVENREIEDIQVIALYPHGGLRPGAQNPHVSQTRSGEEELFKAR